MKVSKNNQKALDEMYHKETYYCPAYDSPVKNKALSLYLARGYFSQHNSEEKSLALTNRTQEMRKKRLSVYGHTPLLE